jgi:uncharacterized membrane protein
MASAQSMGRAYDEPVEHSGWVSFAGIMLMLVGTFNVIDGIVAVSNSDYLVNQLLFSNMDAWGWFFIVWGAAQVVIGVAVLGGATWAAIAGVISAFFNAVAQLSWSHTYPVWSVAAIVLDGLVIYALVVYGGRRNT